MKYQIQFRLFDENQKLINGYIVTRFKADSDRDASDIFDNAAEFVKDSVSLDDLTKEYYE
jgi:hypothetical protein